MVVLIPWRGGPACHDALVAGPRLGLGRHRVNVDLPDLFLKIAISVFFLALGLTVRRPSIRGNGGGGGDSATGQSAHVTFENRGAVLGIGVARETAEDVQAFLIDARSARHLGVPLWWQLSDATFATHVQLKAGGRANLYLIEADTRLASEYFIFAPPSGAPRSAARPKFIDAEREFTVELRDSVDRRHRFAVVARLEGGRISVAFKITWRTRLYRLRKAARVFRSAFSRQ
jgi:hypothetical protein